MTHRQDLGFTFTCIIDATVERVFHTITDQHAISTFFTDHSSGPLTTGATVHWHFDELDIDVDVQVEEVIPNQRIVCNWPAARGVGHRTQFSFTFQPNGNGTAIHVTESAWRRDDAGLASAFDQCSGWTHFFASLKARLEHNVNLKHFFADEDALGPD